MSPQPSEPYLSLTPPNSQLTRTNYSPKSPTQRDYDSLPSLPKTNSIASSGANILTPDLSAPDLIPEEPQQHQPNQKKPRWPGARRKRELSPKRGEAIIPTTPSENIPETQLDDDESDYDTPSQSPVVQQHQRHKSWGREQVESYRPLSPPSSYPHDQLSYEIPPSAQPPHSSFSSTWTSQFPSSTESSRAEDVLDSSTDHINRNKEPDVLAFHAIVEGMGRMHVDLSQDHAGRWRIKRTGDGINDRMF